jgi:hypothetical protein
MGRSGVPRMLELTAAGNDRQKMLFAERSHGKDIGTPKARPRSDHFDGNRFFNPTLPKVFSIARPAARDPDVSASERSTQLKADAASLLGARCAACSGTLPA